MAGGTVNLASTNLTMQMSAVFTNAGTVNWNSGRFQEVNNNFYNLAGATFNLQCDQILGDYSGQEVFYNEGAIHKIGGAGTTSVQIVLNNSGTVQVKIIETVQNQRPEKLQTG